MQRRDGRILVSPTDLVGHLACRHHTTLNLRDLDGPLPRAEDDEQAQLIQSKGDDHEAAYLADLKASGYQVAEITSSDLDQQVADTREALRSGPDIIFQAALRSGPLIGHADFLRRVERPSMLGPFSYEVIDTKLATQAKPKFAVQLAFYARLLAEAQGVAPENAYIALGDGSEVPLHLGGYRYYLEEALSRLLDHVADPPETRPQPCEHCPICPWRDICHARWVAEDHLSFVAGIRRDQIAKLEAAGVATLADLADLEPGTPIPNLAPATLESLRRQARLQHLARQTGEDRVELLEADSEGRRGFHRLPRPSPGDLFFDMEGDPLEEGGLEYLFGVYFLEGDEARFRAFWAHDREEERQAFEAFMDLVAEQLGRYPEAHIYHYAPYEEVALKRLMALHGTREAEVDDLLRRGKLVDLYKVVREAIRVSEPAYSIKNLERFYMGKREAEVVDAGASIVAYERYRATEDIAILKEIEAYNADDCRSTYELRQWLLDLCPDDLPAPIPEAEPATGERPDRVAETEARLERYRGPLIDRNRPEPELDRLTFQLLDFHRRERKPQWWAIFARQDASEGELVDDPECLGGLTLEGSVPVTARSRAYSYRYPDQEHKLRVGDEAWQADPPVRIGAITELDEQSRTVTVRSTGELPAELTIGRGNIVGTQAIDEALFRFADSRIAQAGTFPAIEAFLRREPPRISGHAQPEPILPGQATLLDEVADAIGGLEESYLFIQGPPGAGKTYTGSYAIAELIRRGYRVGVTSNSHKAINHLLSDVEGWASQRGIGFQGVRKAREGNTDSEFDGRWIGSVYRNQEAIDALADGASLLAGTAWLLARPELQRSLDYLFIDEAGQVALAKLVGMATASRNLVLLGDQMQLGQPIQGTHPGRSGESALEYLLDGRATIEANLGIFLPRTYRMHPAITRLISDAIYEGRLEAAPGLSRQRLRDPGQLPEPLHEAGIATLEVGSEGCSQRCEAEAEAIAHRYEALLGHEYVDKHGEVATIGPKDILVVAPYNMQVNLLQERLGPEAHVGTVDRFQGQEAEVVLVSMTTSSELDLPRHLDFLFSRNRLNVAISRARILAVVAMNPRLMAVSCRTLEQMRLVNTLCQVHRYAEDQPGQRTT